MAVHTGTVKLPSQNKTKGISTRSWQRILDKFKSQLMKAKAVTEMGMHPSDHCTCWFNSELQRRELHGRIQHKSPKIPKEINIYEILNRFFLKPSFHYTSILLLYFQDFDMISGEMIAFVNLSVGQFSSFSLWLFKIFLTFHRVKPGPISKISWKLFAKSFDKNYSNI